VRLPDAIVVLQFLRAPLFLALLAATFTFVQVLSRWSPAPRTV
jgi:hypothetical protein